MKRQVYSYLAVGVLGFVLGVGLRDVLKRLPKRPSPASLVAIPKRQAATDARRCQHLRDAQGKQGELYLKQLRDIYGEGYHPCLDKELLGMLDTMVLAPVQPSRREEEERAR